MSSTPVQVNNPEYIETLQKTYQNAYNQIKEIYRNGVKELLDEFHKGNLIGQQALQFYTEKQQEMSTQFYKNIYIGLDNNKLNQVKSLISQAEKIQEQLKAINVTQIGKDIQEELKKQEINILIEETAKDMLNYKLDEMLNTNIHNILSKFNFNISQENCFNEVKNYIWAFGNAKELCKEDLDKIKADIVESLTKSLNDWSLRILQDTKQEVQDIIPHFDDIIDDYKEQLDELEKLDIQKNILDKMQVSLQDKIQNKLESLDDKINSVLGHIGLEVDLSGALSNNVQLFSKHINDSVGKFIEPILNNQKKNYENISKEIEKYEKLTQQYEQQVSELLNKWENTAQEFLKQQEEKLVNSIISSINIKF